VFSVVVAERAETTTMQIFWPVSDAVMKKFTMVGIYQLKFVALSVCHAPFFVEKF
jgi:hypothetical protein